MATRTVAWDATKAAHAAGRLRPEHAQIYFQNPRPVFELYDLENDPFELNNLAGQAAVSAIERDLRERLDRWMVGEGDYVPLPTHAFQNR